MRRTKKCLYCGKEFSTQSAVKKYCCTECAEAAKQEIKKKRNSLLNELAPIANLQQQDYFTFSQAATLMGCSRQYIYKLVAQGKLYASRISNRMAIISRTDIEEMLTGHPYRRVIPCQRPKANRTCVCKSQQKGKETQNEPMEYYSGEDVMRIYKVKQSWLYTSANLTAIIKKYHISKERIGVSNLLLKSDVERAIAERRAKGLF